MRILDAKKSDFPNGIILFSAVLSIRSTWRNLHLWFYYSKHTRFIWLLSPFRLFKNIMEFRFLKRYVKHFCTY